jgi:hypothetical protein
LVEQQLMARGGNHTAPAFARYCAAQLSVLVIAGRVRIVTLRSAALTQDRRARRFEIPDGPAT